MKKRFRKLVSVTFALMLTVSMLPAYDTDVKAATVSGHELKNPTKESYYTEWDCVWFGSYPQAEVVQWSSFPALDSPKMLEEGDVIISEELYNKLLTAKDDDWNDNGDIYLEGAHYRRIKNSDTEKPHFPAGSVTQPLGESLTSYHWNSDSEYHYFKYEPIKWRVLSANGNDVLLLADKGLDDPAETCNRIGVWESSGTRSWLNEDSSKSFINTAFSSKQQSMIRETVRIENNKALYDRIFLLSESDATTTAYGFHEESATKSSTRLCRSTTYAKAMGTVIETATYGPFYGTSPWLLSSIQHVPGSRVPPYDLQHSIAMGAVVPAVNNWLGMCAGYSAVRPALHLTLSSSSGDCSYAGTVRSN